jgi:glutaredoxin 3
VLKGRRVLLIDDVMTTGATVFACARVRRRRGAAGVGVLLLAPCHSLLVIRPDTAADRRHGRGPVKPLTVSYIFGVGRRLARCEERGMARVEIYSTMFCPFCYRAKQLLEAKGVDYEELDVTMRPGRRREMMERAAGQSSVPQIFIDDTCIGGCDELYALEATGKLDPLLKGKV